MKKVYSIIIEILLILSIMFAMVSIFVKYVVLDKNTYLNILNKNNTYEQITDSIYAKMDNMLSSKNINIDIKESIITEDDIKKEADNMISGFIDYLQTGKNNVKPIDVETYKQRVKDIIGNLIKPTTTDLSFNSNIQAENVVCTGNEIKYNNMVVSKEQSKVGQSSIEVQKLMTRSEAEAKAREILKQKGLTEDQAVQKAIEKGITEDQALKILAGYGITIDGESDGATSGNSDNSNSSSTQGNDNIAQGSDNVAQSSENATQGSNNTIGSSNDKASSNSQTNGQTDSQTKNAISQTQGDKNIKSQFDGILNKLLDDATSNIEKEVNLDKILESNKLQELAQITSIIYKMFWMFMILPIVLIAILIKINSKDMISGIKYVRNAFLLTGLILFAIFFGSYELKVYEKLNINIVYLKDVIYYTIKHFLIILSTYGITTFVIGLFLFIPTIKKFK